MLLDTLRKGGVPTIGPGTTMLPANAIKATGSEELKARILPGRHRRRDPDLPGVHRTGRRIRCLRLRDAL